MKLSKLLLTLIFRPRPSLLPLTATSTVRTVYTPGARKHHYIASGELSRFATSYIEEELLPRVRTAQERIKRMERMMQSLPETDRQLPAERIDRLKYWLGKGQKVVPWLVRFLKL